MDSDDGFRNQDAILLISMRITTLPPLPTTIPGSILVLVEPGVVITVAQSIPGSIQSSTLVSYMYVQYMRSGLE